MQENPSAAIAAQPQPKVLRPEHTGARVTVLVQPEESLLSLPRPANCWKCWGWRKRPPWWLVKANC